MADPDPATVVAQVRNQYNTLNGKFDQLLQQCGNDDVLKRQLGDSIQEALDNYIEAQNRVLDANTDHVKALGDAVTKTQNDIDAALTGLQNIKTVLNTITKGVKIVATAVAVLG
jgi:chromosome segregation ATPase